MRGLHPQICDAQQLTIGNDWSPFKGFSILINSYAFKLLIPTEVPYSHELKLPERLITILPEQVVNGVAKHLELRIRTRKGIQLHRECIQFHRVGYYKSSIPLGSLAGFSTHSEILMDT